MHHKWLTDTPAGLVNERGNWMSDEDDDEGGKKKE